MYFNLLLAATIIIACIVFSKISSRLGIPVLLIFILFGMFCGSDGVLQIAFDNYELAEQICTIALIYIMFYGGFGTKWDTAKPVVIQSVLLSTLGVVLTAACTGLFCHYVLQMEMAQSLLIGALVSSTDAASVFSILRSKRLNLKYHTASLLEVESGSNDPCSYMFTVIMIGIANGEQSSAGAIAYTVFSQIVYGAAAGALLAAATVLILQKIRFTTEGFETIFVFAAALLAYAVPSLFGGNGFLSVYILGVILGNVRLENKRRLVHFFDGLTGLMQMLLFFLLGLLSFPSQLPKVMAPALAVAVFLIFVARPIAVFLILKPFGCPMRQLLLVSWAGLRGAASIVFAIMARIEVTDSGTDLFHMVFFIVLVSILLQGTLLPYMARRLSMIDAKEDVRKTFTDYSEEMPLQFMEISVRPEHRWAGNYIRDIDLPPDTMFVQMTRNDEPVAVTGETKIEQGDVLVLSTRTPKLYDNMRFTELLLENGHKWIGKTISELNLEAGRLVILIKRGEEIVIPKGDTALLCEDKLVIKETV